MSEQEEIKIFEKITKGLKDSYESLLRRKAALGQNIVVADEKGLPRIVSARKVLQKYRRHS